MSLAVRGIRRSAYTGTFKDFVRIGTNGYANLNELSDVETTFSKFELRNESLS